MSKYCKSITKTVRREFGRFPNCEMSEEIQLGRICTYTGWPRPKFNWTRSLNDFGIDIVEKERGEFTGMVDEHFSIGHNTSVSFHAGESGKDEAVLTFGSSNTLIAQATSLASIRLDTAQLERSLKEAIRGGTNWSKDYAVVTHILYADCFTQFYASSKGAEACICTNRESGGSAFNLADRNLELGLSMSKGAIHHLLATENVTPFFLVHKLKGWRREYPVKSDWSEDDLYLERYG